VVALVYFLMTRPGGGRDQLSTGEFLAFMSAFSALLTGLLDVGASLVGVINVVPTYDRLRPILRAVPELDDTRADPGVLRGRIEVSNVTFRYRQDDPPVLDAVNIQAEPGEFVAIVGPSGSGKSTMLRVLLGFERAESGSVAYDGFDLESLDIQAVRKQCGVVLQDGALLPGDIFTNIIGSSVELTLEDAWEAARMAGLDKDVEAMPMGMHTVIPEGGGSLSGGQRQRLMIARALVNRPRVVFFDEATSALDNPTQAIVTASLDRLNSTRIVIAHRLSTVVNADKIYVLEKGRLAQSGTYEQLMQTPGTFQDLARRQIA
jgi:ATP-binding cassette subfamily C protein